MALWFQVWTAKYKLVIIKSFHWSMVYIMAGQSGQWYPLWNAGWSEWSVVSTMERGLVRMVSGQGVLLDTGQVEGADGHLTTLGVRRAR